jgi:hypothetical protein
MYGRLEPKQYGLGHDGRSLRDCHVAVEQSTGRVDGIGGVEGLVIRPMRIYKRGQRRFSVVDMPLPELACPRGQP